jgi:general L-amino acid transport system permease protein
MAVTDAPNTQVADPRFSGGQILKDAPKASFFYRPEVRSAIYQIILVAVIAFVFYSIISNTLENLRRQNIASGFGFWNRTAGFDIGESLIPYAATSTYGTAFWVGMLNTLAVSIFGIFFATILGFIIGIARMSSNWLVARLSTVYVEVLRNMPLLLLLLFWYFAVLKTLPQARNAVSVPGGGFFSNRGLNLPRPEYLPGLEYVGIAVLLAIAGWVVLAKWAKARQMATGQTFPAFWTGLGVLIGLPLIVAAILGWPMQLDMPVKGAFNFSGGMVLTPEFLALLLGLSVYTSAPIAEIVRAGVLAVSKGQKEAAAAIGLPPSKVLQLVVIPQAMRMVIPPLTSNYLSLTKNSSLALAIAYPDLVSVTGTMLNQTGQAVEIILLIMGCYLTLSLLTSLFMNWFNSRMALVER